MSIVRSGRLVIHLSYLPPEEHMGDDGAPNPWEEEWTILRVLPECPSRRIDKGRLCDACWLLEHVDQCGLDYFTEPLEWEGRGKEAATIVVSGVLTFEESNTTEGHDYEESFDVISMDVLPPEPEPVDVEPENLDAMPWCESCQSYHMEPKSRKQYVELQCKAVYADQAEVEPEWR